MAVEMLYTGESVRRAIRDLFRTGRGRRVAVSAFVGSGAETYLPRPAGIELYCWPSPGGTNPAAIRNLIKRDVDVHFADRLHAKVYWAAGRGAVITSANLSTNAFGRGELREVGVRLPAPAVDIDRIIRSAGAVEVTPAALRRLESAWAARGAARTPRSGGTTFPMWYGGPRTRDARWLLSISEGYGVTSQALRQRVYDQHASRTVTDWVSCRRGEVVEDDYVLFLNFKATKLVDVGWVHADHIVRVGRDDRAYDANYPYQVGQVAPLRHYRPPPFVLDGAFRRAVRATYAELKPYDGQPYLPTAPPPRRFLNAIMKHYAVATS